MNLYKHMRNCVEGSGCMGQVQCSIVQFLVRGALNFGFHGPHGRMIGDESGATFIGVRASFLPIMRPLTDNFFTNGRKIWSKNVKK